MVVVAIAATLLALAGALATAAAVSGAFSANGWTTRLPMLGLTVNVPGLLRLATSPLGRRLLDGRALNSPIGQLRLARHDRALIVFCAPCRFNDPRLASQTVTIPALELRLTAAGPRRIDGALSVAGTTLTLVADLHVSGVDLAWELAASDVAPLVRLFAAAVPEAQRAQIDGRIRAYGKLHLPSLRAASSMDIDGFAVSGLGTETLQTGLFEHGCRAAGGRMTAQLNGGGTRHWIALEALGLRLPAAVIGAEDQRFYAHAGIDTQELDGVLASIDLREMRGASTLSQQLARTLFTGGERTLARKLRETLYAVEMERTLGKDRIFALYLNTVDWGPGVCGAKAAARAYFRKSPAQLSTLEAAWLAGALRNPYIAYDSEFRRSAPDLQRAHWVVRQMRDLPRAERNLALRGWLEFPGAARGAPRGQAADSASIAGASFVESPHDSGVMVRSSGRH